MIKQPTSLAIAFAGATALFAGSFYTMVTVDAGSAQSRFEVLVDDAAYGRSISHGEQTIALRLKEGVEPETLIPLKLKLAHAHRFKGQKERAVELYNEVLNSRTAVRYNLEQRDALKEYLGALYLDLSMPIEAASIYAGFLEKAGDAVAGHNHEETPSDEDHYRHLIDDAMPSFAELLPPENVQDLTDVISQEAKVEIARDMAALGGYYSKVDGGNYAAAGLLSAAYGIQKEILGTADQDTLHTVLMLGPVYREISRDKNAEEIYLEAFHAQERQRGANNPDLSLYIRLLADVYKDQGRLTEAEALNSHIQRLFKDAFGARRYVSNKMRDRRHDVNRPVSANFPLEEDYIPNDLVKMVNFEVPLSKNADVEEMSVRMAKELDAEQERSLPSELEKLLSTCSQFSEEKLSLRSGYRSYKTQAVLYQRLGHKGTVTKPGTSEHQLGLAVDIDVNRRLMRQTDRSYQCFEENAWRYGFILSYPKGNTYLPGEDTYEPWHWRYVGKRTALLYREAGPLDKPQEFLAALPCYEERAMAGIWSIASEKDVCLEGVSEKFMARTSEKTTAELANVNINEKAVVQEQ